MTEAERLSIVYMVAVVNSRIDYDIMSEGSQSGCKEDFKRAQKACLLNYLYHCGKAFFHTPIGAAFKIAVATYKYDGCDRESRLRWKICHNQYENQESSDSSKIAKDTIQENRQTL